MENYFYEVEILWALDWVIVARVKYLGDALDEAIRQRYNNGHSSRVTDYTGKVIATWNPLK